MLNYTVSMQSVNSRLRKVYRQNGPNVSTDKLLKFKKKNGEGVYRLKALKYVSG